MNTSSDRFPNVNLVPPFRYSIVQRKMIAEAYADGETSTSLGRRWNASPTTILAIVREAGLKVRPKQGTSLRLTKPQIAIALREYQQGRSANSIALQMGVSGKTIILALRAAGILTRNQAQSTRQHADDIEQLFANDYLSGWSITEVARKHRVPRHQIVLALHRLKIPLRQKCPKNDRFFENPSTEEQSYWLGFLAADGHVSVSGKQVILALASRDRSHVVLFRDTVSPKSKITDRKKIGKDGKILYQTGVSISSVQMNADLVRHGLNHDKTWTLRPWGGPAHLMRHYWRGFFDGDGGFSRIKSGIHKGDVNLGWCGTRAVCEAFQGFVQTHLQITPNSLFFNGSIWIANYSSLSDVQRIAHLLYDDASVYLPRKREIAEQVWQIFPRKKDWRHITGEELLALYAEEETWMGVARRLGTSLDQVYKMRIQRGLPMKVSRWAFLDESQLHGLFAEYRSWKRVAEVLGLSQAGMSNLKRRIERRCLV